jgi:hypothetical protein
MGRSADKRWAKYVLAELDSHDAAMRFEAATAAGELALAAAVDPLIRLMDDPDSSVRGAAAMALGEIGGPAARRALEAAARNNDEVLAAAAEDALETLSFNSGSMNDAIFDFSGKQLPGDDEDAEIEDEDSEADVNVDDDYDSLLDESGIDDGLDYGEEDGDWADEDEEERYED